MPLPPGRAPAPLAEGVRSAPRPDGPGARGAGGAGEGHLAGQGGEPSHAIRQRVAAARSLQATRYGGLGILVNAELTAPLIKRFVALDPPARATMEGAAGRAGLSARAYRRVLKVARVDR
ncbi:MAG: hypothetical protein U0166_07300 [Acidobacteriota bacterium]